MNAPRKFTIRMTRGMFVVSEDDANRVLEAVEKDETHVLVSADTMGDGLYVVPVQLIVSHVIALVENARLEDFEPAMPGERRLRSVKSDPH